VKTLTGCGKILRHHAVFTIMRSSTDYENAGSPLPRIHSLDWSCRPFDLAQDKLRPASRAGGGWIPACAGRTEQRVFSLCRSPLHMNLRRRHEDHEVRKNYDRNLRVLRAFVVSPLFISSATARREPSAIDCSGDRSALLVRNSLRRIGTPWNRASIICFSPPHFSARSFPARRRVSFRSPCRRWRRA